MEKIAMIISTKRGRKLYFEKDYINNKIEIKDLDTNVNMTEFINDYDKKEIKKALKELKEKKYVTYRD